MLVLWPWRLWGTRERPEYLSWCQNNSAVTWERFYTPRPGGRGLGLTWSQIWIVLCTKKQTKILKNVLHWDLTLDFNSSSFPHADFLTTSPSVLSTRPSLSFHPFFDDSQIIPTQIPFPVLHYSLSPSIAGLVLLDTSVQTLKPSRSSVSPDHISWCVSKVVSPFNSKRNIFVVGPTWPLYLTLLLSNLHPSVQLVPKLGPSSPLS